MTSESELRRRGFRPLLEGTESEVFSARAEVFGYEVITHETVVWVRRGFRKKGAPLPLAFRVGQAIRPSNLGDPTLRLPLRMYRNTGYARHQDRVTSDSAELVEALGWHRDEAEIYRKLNAISKPLSFCSADFLPDFVFEHVLPAFFEFDHNGAVLVVTLNEEMERPFSLVRSAYAMRHAPLSTLKELNKGAPTLRVWEQAQLTDYVDALLSLMQVVSYPFIQLFHGGPIGLSTVFILSSSLKHEPAPFPRSWLHWARSDSGFAAQSMDRLKALSDPDSPEFDHLAHHRYQFASPIAPDNLETFLRWSIERLNHIAREASDPANFIDKAGKVDFTFCFEHNLTLIRVLKLALHVAASEEMPQAKLRTFEVADALEGLAYSHRRGTTGEFFKLLFTPDRALEMVKGCMKTLPEGVRARFEMFAEVVYRQLRDVAIASVWHKDVVTDAGVQVKGKDLKTIELKSVDEYTGELLRALRNTHHGYFTHLDISSRPSRYLAISEGDVPDAVSSLPLIWVIALLANPTAMVGWEPLGTGEYD